MSTEGGDLATLAASRWPPRGARPKRPESPALYTYLLDADGDLAEALDVRTRIAVRQHATVRMIEADAGECDLESWFGAVGQGPGLLILDGLVAVDTCLTSRTVTELLGSGDLLQPLICDIDEIVKGTASWRALGDCRFALLDEDFAERMQPWPQIGHALMRRTERRTEDLGVMRAIACQPKLEVRLVLFLWHVAARWGRVEPSGIRLRLPLTHRLLGQLVSAERPSISHALGRLTEAGLISGMAGDWHLRGSLDSHLATLIEEPSHLGTTRDRRRSGGGRIG